MGENPTSCVLTGDYTHILCFGLICFVVPGLTRDPFFLCNTKTRANGSRVKPGMTVPLMKTSGKQAWGFDQQEFTKLSGDMGYLLSETR